MSGLPNSFYIPELLTKWPWDRAIHPDYEAVKAESNAWFHSCKAFSEQSQITFDKGNFALLASLAYPCLSREHLRTGCDMMILFFVIDEYTDVESEPMVRRIRTSNDPVERLFSEKLLASKYISPEWSRYTYNSSFRVWELAIKTASVTSQRHMMERFTEYLEGVVEEARDRDTDTHSSIESYLEKRRRTVGALPSFVPNELDLDIPDDVYHHPDIDEMSMLATDLVIFANDIMSYKREQGFGNDSHNVLTVAMRKLNINLQGAVLWATKCHADLEARFLEKHKRIPSWGSDIDGQVQKYIDGLGRWIRGNMCWDFESERYFGSKGLEVQKTRWIELLPKYDPSKQDTLLQQENVVVRAV